jgi:hypothetical protein
MERQGIYWKHHGLVADDPQYVWDWIKAEPFYSDGIYENVEVRRWTVAIGALADR